MLFYRMGAYLTRRSAEVEELEQAVNFPYTFPPKTGSYFGTYFYLGGKKFEVAQPEAFLFGDNADLNYLGPQPHSLPYQCPAPDKPVRALKCLINIRKDSLRLIRVPNPPNKPADSDIIATRNGRSEVSMPPLYNIEFTFDADCPCAITIYYNCSESMQGKSVVYTTTSSDHRCDTVHYNAGGNQQFCMPSHVINPALLHNNSHRWDPNNIPIVIQASAECGAEFKGHSHVTYACFEKVSDESWNIKSLKQKQAINGVCYLFQEIYGIENKKNGEEVGGDVGIPDDGDEENAECVVCLSDARDTLILPCKHLCLCSSCANQLRFQQSGCPICRQSFRALLQIRAVRKRGETTTSSGEQVVADDVESTGQSDSEENADNAPPEVSIPDGYEVVPLISALCGPTSINTTDGASEATPSPRLPQRRKSSRKKSRVVMEQETATGEEDVYVNERRLREKQHKNVEETIFNDNVTNPTTPPSGESEIEGGIADGNAINADVVRVEFENEENDEPHYEEILCETPLPLAVDKEDKI
ncbi:unnamed protein product [Clavelina lepadiformis]|uniref:RING-type E3 ubiquitin transferase n=2 Tax=Clavelina lepadiformis TaxID=159417 RepID=A0ABP0FV68_CLALP